jgi:hypothetical protein
LDKKKLQITKTGDKTTIQNRFGTNYKNVSALIYETIKIKGPADFKNFMDKNNEAFDINSVIESAELAIKNWIRNSELEIEEILLEDKSQLNELICFLEQHVDTKGIREAKSCLSGLHLVSRMVYGAKSRCNEESTYAEINTDYENLLCHALHLLASFNNFYFAITESTLYLGKSRVEKMIKKSTKLTEEQYLALFEYYDSLDTTREGRKLTKQEKWDLVAKLSIEELGIQISTQTLRKKYSFQ